MYLTFNQIAFNSKEEVSRYHQGWDMARGGNSAPGDPIRLQGYEAWMSAYEARNPQQWVVAN